MATMTADGEYENIYDQGESDGYIAGYSDYRAGIMNRYVHYIEIRSYSLWTIYTNGFAHGYSEAYQEGIRIPS